MEIEKKEAPPKGVPFETVRIGEVFMYSFRFYMKLDDNTRNYQAIELKQAFLTTFSSDAVVYPVHSAKLIVEI